MRKGIIGILIMFLVAGVYGCMTTGSDRTNTVGQGSALGALGGAAGGALIGYLVDGKKGAVKGALAGAAVGAIGGAMYGNHVANTKEKFATQEDYLDACIAEAQTVCNDTLAYNDSLRAEMDGLEQNINDLVQQYNNKQIAKSKMITERKALEDRLAVARQKLQRAKDEIAIQRAVLSKEADGAKKKLVAMQQEITRLEQAVEELDSQTQALASMSQRMAV